MADQRNPRREQLDDALSLIEREASVLLDGSFGQRGIEAGRVWMTAIESIRETLPAKEQPYAMASPD